MVSLFKKPGTKHAAELAKNLREALVDTALSPEKRLKETAKYIGHMRAIIAAAVPPPPVDTDSAAAPPTVDSAAESQVVLLANEICDSGLLTIIVQNLDKFDFEAKKDVVYVINHLLRRQVGSRFPTVEKIERSERQGAVMLGTLVRSYEVDGLAMTVGSILRECAEHEPLARMILYSPEFWNFFRYVESYQFDVASDAFATFRALLTIHKELVSAFLVATYDTFFEHYNALLQSSNFVTKRQSLKLLGELLLDRANFDVMTRYISSAAKLKQIMVLLRDKSRPIQYEAFHVFKVFVANPNKVEPVHDILAANKSALKYFLENFQNDREEDEQFKDEKAFLIQQIELL